MHKLANAVQNKVYRLYRQYLKEPTLQIQARATTGVGKPQADSEGNERIPPDSFDTTALEAALHGKIPPPPSGGPPPFSREAHLYLGSLEKGAGSRRLTEGFFCET